MNQRHYYDHPEKNEALFSGQARSLSAGEAFCLADGRLERLQANFSRLLTFPKKYAIIFDKSAWNGFCILENRHTIPLCIDDVIL